MDSCLFCKIIAGQIPSDKVYEDDRCYAFRDINPQAPVHILIVPKTHVADVAECTEKDSALAGHVLKVAREARGTDKRLPSGDERRSRRLPVGEAFSCAPAGRPENV